MKFWKEILTTKPSQFEELNQNEWKWFTKIKHIPKTESPESVEQWEALVTVIDTSIKEELDLELEKPCNLELARKQKELEEKTLIIQEAFATLYEESSKYQTQMQEAIATLYEQILNSSSGDQESEPPTS